jgi:pimeloyl-ACP methyl ester carboxylesterase
MRRTLTPATIVALMLWTGAPPAEASQASRTPPVGRTQVASARPEGFSTRYVRLANQDTEGLLYEPAKPGPNARIALVYTHPNANTFNEPLGREMAARGYRVLMVNHRGDTAPEAYLPSISRGLVFARSLPGVTRVVLVGHSGGGHLVALYQNVAEHGPAACNGPEKIYPCKAEELEGLAKPDGLVLLDPTLGAFHQMSAVDPAIDEDKRIVELDMFAPANGYDLAEKRARYTPAFAKRFYRAQSDRNARIVAEAQERLRLISKGAGRFTDDEPLVIPGLGQNAAGARLYQPDVAFAAHTKAAHLLLRADGERSQQVIASVRPPSGQQTPAALGSLSLMTQNTTVRRFLAASAIRTRADYAITADDIVGVDWSSAMTATPANAEGVTVPSLVLTMSCHYLVVPGEIIFDHLGSKEKTYAAVEGATHQFNACRPEYGDTVQRTFDFVDVWLGQKGRF